MIGRAEVERSTHYLEIANFMMLPEEMTFLRQERKGIATLIDETSELIQVLDGIECKPVKDFSLGLALANFYLRNNAEDYSVTELFRPVAARELISSVINADGIDSEILRQVWIELRLREHWLIEEIEMVAKGLDVFSEHFKVGVVHILVPLVVMRDNRLN